MINSDNISKISADKVKRILNIKDRGRDALRGILYPDENQIPYPEKLENIYDVSSRICRDLGRHVHEGLDQIRQESDTELDVRIDIMIGSSQIIGCAMIAFGEIIQASIDEVSAIVERNEVDDIDHVISLYRMIHRDALKQMSTMTMWVEEILDPPGADFEYKFDVEFGRDLIEHMSSTLDFMNKKSDDDGNFDMALARINEMISAMKSQFDPSATTQEMAERLLFYCIATHASEKTEKEEQLPAW